jgi:PKD repeat protein
LVYRNDGPASVAVDELFWMGNKLIAVTHGRGMFSIIPTIGGPSLVNNGFSISGGNGDGSVDPNECLQLNLMIQNAGGAAATNITATLSTTTPGVSVTRSNSAYPNLSNGVSAANKASFQMITSPSFVCGTPVTLNLSTSYGGGANNLTYVLPSGGSNYAMTVSSGSAIVPGVTDIGNHGDDATTAIALPFPVSFYGATYSAATLDSNGRLAFGPASSLYQNVCLPSGNPATLCPLWDDLRTDGSGGGIFISTNGSAPSRIFNVEWRATYYSGGAPANFEIRLYENSPRIDFVYGTISDNGANGTVGIEGDSTSFSQVECNSGGISNSVQVVFQKSCNDGGGICVPLVPTVDFSALPASGAVPLTVSFTNLTLDATNYVWVFGDGNASALANPINTYSNAGIYTVTLVATGPGGSNSLTRSNYIAVTNLPLPTVNFSATPPSGAVPLTASFTNLTLDATNYAWVFGDGNASALANPVNTYSNAGIYTVSLQGIGPGGSNSLTRSNYIVVTNVPPTIVSQPLSQIAVSGTNVSFSVSAIGTAPLSYQWQHNSSDSPGATSTVLSLTNIQTGDGGLYSVVVANAAGSITSSPAALNLVYLLGFISIDGSPYVETFDEMGPAGTNPPYGWYAGTGTAAISENTITSGNGSSSLARNYNFGANGGTDRALGSIAGSSTQRDSEAHFVNISGQAISSMNISYTGEQWRYGGAGAVANTLFLQYSVDGTNFSNLDNQFNFVSPTLSSVSVALDGNNPTNRVTGIGGTFSPAVAITNGQPFYLRWADPDDTGPDMGLALDDLVITFTLGTPPPPVVAAFSSDATIGVAPLTVVFTNLSTGATNYAWDFGDGNVSVATDPTNTYTNAGSFSVTLTATGPGGTNALTLTNYITVTNIPAPPVIAAFTAGPTSGIAPLTVIFTNLSTGATNYVWDFGDGNVSIEQNPTNTFTNAGLFSVSLTATGPGGTNALTLTNYILVIGLPVLVVSPGNLDFGLNPTDVTAHASFVISNAGPSTLAGSAALNPGVFSITAGTPFSVDPNGWTNLLVDFTPGGSGAFTNVIVFTSNGGISSNSVVGRALSAPVLLVTPSGPAEFDFSFPTLPGFSYSVQYKDFLTDPVWLPLQTLPGDGSTIFITNAVASPERRLYRLLVQ